MTSYLVYFEILFTIEQKNRFFTEKRDVINLKDDIITPIYD